ISSPHSHIYSLSLHDALPILTLRYLACEISWFGDILSETRVLVSSVHPPAEHGGRLLEIPRHKAGWEWMGFFVTRLQPGEMLQRSEEHTSELQSLRHIVCRLL